MVQPVAVLAKPAVHFEDHIDFSIREGDERMYENYDQTVSRARCPFNRWDRCNIIAMNHYMASLDEMGSFTLLGTLGVEHISDGWSALCACV